jgi:hypothetical protein
MILSELSLKNKNYGTNNSASHGIGPTYYSITTFKESKNKKKELTRKFKKMFRTYVPQSNVGNKIKNNYVCSGL